VFFSYSLLFYFTAYATKVFISSNRSRNIYIVSKWLNSSKVRIVYRFYFVLLYERVSRLGRRCSILIVSHFLSLCAFFLRPLQESGLWKKSFRTLPRLFDVIENIEIVICITLKSVSCNQFIYFNANEIFATEDDLRRFCLQFFPCAREDGSMFRTVQLKIMFLRHLCPVLHLIDDD